MVLTVVVVVDHCLRVDDLEVEREYRPEKRKYLHSGGDSISSLIMFLLWMETTTMPFVVWH